MAHWEKEFMESVDSENYWVYEENLTRVIIELRYNIIENVNADKSVLNT